VRRPDSWHDSNDAYLGAALGWLRIRLERMNPVALPSPEAEPRPAGLFGRGRPAVPPRPPPRDDPEERELTAARVMREATQVDPPPALLDLAARLGLSPFEQDVLLLCAAVAFDTRLPQLCARAQDDPQRAYPTFALALALFDEPSWDALSAARPLRAWRLIEIHQGRGEPLTTAALRADERIVNALKGLDDLDDRLAAYLQPVATQKANVMPGLELPLQAAIQALHADDDGVLPVLNLHGPDHEGQTLLAEELARLHGLTLYRADAASLPSSAGDADTLGRLWQREARLAPVGLLLGAPPESPPVVLQALGRQNASLLCVASRDPLTGLNLPHRALEVPLPGPAEQEHQWLQAAPDLAPTLAAALAQQFTLGPATLARLAAQYPPETLWEACRTSTRAALDSLATRVDVRAQWPDLVLPAEQLELLHQLTAQVRHRHTVYEEWGFAARLNRGLGISALFAGESGTGKTMAAEVIASDLKLDLVRIDLAGVVSKYIGETEKNLRRIFDAAEGGGAILLFDEADALFGKRSEVKDSHDRYANIEVNYLLQRVEGYRGVAILATNVRSALDSAFTRRLRFIVTFPFPGLEERQRLWRQAYPAGVDTGALDLGVLARFALSGAGVQNAALASAFRAAARGDHAVQQLDALQAIRAELIKQERPISDPLLNNLGHLEVSA
jgi:ATPase family associated with various cellular activities (AAA)